MAQKTGVSQSHLGFFVAMLVVSLLAYGAWRAVDKYYFTTQQQQQTAATNPGLTRPPKDHQHPAAAAEPGSADKPATVEAEGPK